jgi:hypothetical protein
MLQVFPSRCCICFVLATHVSLAFQTYVASVLTISKVYITNVFSRYCKSRSGVTYVVVNPICSNCLLQLLGPRECGGGASDDAEAEQVQIEMERARDTERHGTLRETDV